jgi:hypothetical protein
MINEFELINKNIFFIQKLYGFFIRFLKLLLLLMFLVILYSFIKNNSEDPIMDTNKTTIINPIMKINDKSNYTIISEKGFSLKNNVYRFENVKILNNNIDIFTKTLDFYDNKNEIILYDRPTIIFNNNKE